MIGVLGPDRTDAVTSVLGRPDVGKKHVLDTRTDGSHGQVAPGELLDLDHAAEVREELDGPPEVVEVVHGPGRVFGNELDVIELSRLADELGDGGPG